MANRGTGRRAGCGRHGVLLTLLLAGPPALSQAPDPAAASAPTTSAPLPQREQEIQARLQHLEGRMLALSRLLAESEPDKAERLRDALDWSGRRQLRHRLERTVALLSACQLSEAEREQQVLLDDLARMLKLLTDTTSDLERRRAERERLEALRRTIRQLQEDQTGQLQRTRAAQGVRALAERFSAAADRLGRLAERQAGLRNEPAPALEPRQALQQELEKQTRTTAEELEQLAQSAAEEHAAAAARDALDQARQAADAMQTARDQMQPAPAAAEQQAQQAAEEHLRRAVQRLSEEAQRLDRQAALDEHERAQRALEQRAGQAAEQMKANGDEPQIPGQPQVAGAQQAMQRAADRLGEPDAEAAQREQHAALEQLQQAQDELDDALRQMRREEREETLAALETRFRSLLQREQQVRSVAGELRDRPAADWSRTDQLKLAEAAQVQRTVVEDAQAVVRLLSGEGTTVILPDLAGQLVADMQEIAARLERADLSPPTLALLDQVIELLQEIVGAVEARRAAEQQAQSQPSGSGADDASPPLLPRSAELKLLRLSQVRLNTRTAALADAPPAGDAAAEARAEQLRSLARRQRQLSDLTQRMNERP